MSVDLAVCLQVLPYLLQDSWYVILCDKFRNERRGLGGAGASPRVSKASKKETDAAAMSLQTDPTAMEATEEATVEVRTTEEVQYCTL